jgi:thiol-disulfide isomerase/thioredoxin
MNEKKAAMLLGVTSLVTLATVGFLGYRLYSQSQMPSQEELAQQARASRQVTSETAQANIEALLKVTLPDLDGKPQPFAQWEGKLRAINYWATWCPPCIEEMPMFSRLQERHAAQGVQFIGIGMDEVEKMQAFVKKTPVSYPLLVGVTSPSDNPGLTVRGMPYTVVLDRAGKVVFSLYGGVKEADLEPLLKKLGEAK